MMNNQQHIVLSVLLVITIIAQNVNVCHSLTSYTIHNHNHNINAATSDNYHAIGRRKSTAMAFALAYPPALLSSSSTGAALIPSTAYRQRTVSTILYSTTNKNKAATKSNSKSKSKPSKPTPSSNKNKNKNKNKDTTDAATISDLDARVLQSILGEGNVDVETEESVKRLLALDRTNDSTDSTKEDTDSKKKKKGGKKGYSSTLFQKAETFDNEFWEALRLKAADTLESTLLYLANRIERDAKVLATLGIYAWERAVADAGRALPSQGDGVMGKVMRDAGFIFSEKASGSSFVDGFLRQVWDASIPVYLMNQILQG